MGRPRLTIKAADEAVGLLGILAVNEAYLLAYAIAPLFRRLKKTHHISPSFPMYPVRRSVGVRRPARWVRR